jgi:hypothetical protein
VCADSAAVFVSIGQVIRADSDQLAVAYFHFTVQLDEPFSLASILWAKASATQHNDHGVQALYCGQGGGRLAPPPPTYWGRQCFPWVT